MSWYGNASYNTWPRWYGKQIQYIGHYFDWTLITDPGLSTVLPSPADSIELHFCHLVNEKRRWSIVRWSLPQLNCWVAFLSQIYLRPLRRTILAHASVSWKLSESWWRYVMGTVHTLLVLYFVRELRQSGQVSHHKGWVMRSFCILLANDNQTTTRHIFCRNADWYFKEQSHFKLPYHLSIY